MMTIAKITAGDGYLYLIRQTARGDSQSAGEQDAAAYYTAQGNPPGRWTGRGAPLLGLAGREVTEEQMRALFGHGSHPDAEAIIDAYLTANVRAGMSQEQLGRVADEAIAAARLGRAFPAYETLEKFDIRVAARLAAIRGEAGREPTTAEVNKVKAEEARRQRAAVAGFDLVFSPVKSAALLWAIDGRPHVRDAIRDAHEAALGDALALIEDHAALTRTGTGGVAQVETGGLIAAAFEHWDSRAGDPNLHTHVAVSSKVQGPDGKWRALDARPLYAMTAAASEAYNTAFEVHLTARLGVTFTNRPDTREGREPVREIAGIPAAMTEFFSRRRAAIEARYAQLVREYRDDHGQDPPAAAAYKLAQQATLDTRQGKKPPAALAGKRAAWRAELQDRFGADAVSRVMNTVPSSPSVPVGAVSVADLSELAERTVAAVSARRSTWTRWNIRAEAERQLRYRSAPLPPKDHRQAADAVTEIALSPRLSICCEAPSPIDEPPELRRPDGESVFTQHAAARYTCQAVLDAETRLINAAKTPAAPGLTSPQATAALDGYEAVFRTILDAGQRALVTAFACEPRLLLAGIGPAGAGKTTAMRALQQVLLQGGRRLVPLATSAAAADVLGRELTARAENLHKFIHEWTAGPNAARLRAGGPVPADVRAFRLSAGDVILVDEAGMAPTFLLDKLVAIAAARGAVVRLIGDDRQLPAVEGGGALRLIASAPGTPMLTELYRFRDPAHAAATLQIRAGNPAAIDWHAAAGRIRAGSRHTMTQAAYDGWKNDMLAGKITLMAAAGGADVTALSARARADRVAAGQVEPDGIPLRDGNLAGIGDWIVTRDNDRRLGVFGSRDWVKNGDDWTVERRLPDGSLRVRSLAHGGLTTLPAGYVGEHVQLLYATTSHRAQGGTVDTAHALVTAGIAREALYVLASRARDTTIFYTATHDLPYDDDDAINQARSDPRAWAAREILLNILANETAPLSATETITTAHDEAVSLSALVPRYLHAAHEEADARYQAAALTAVGHVIGRELVGDPAWGAVRRRLFDAEADGWDPARLLAAVAARRELATADSIARVIADRIDVFLDLDTSPQPPAADPEVPAEISACRPYETAAEARDRLTAVSVAVLGDLTAGRARGEVAWPALIAALRRAENAGFDASDALAKTATPRELRTARSVSETLAWRINRHVAVSSPLSPPVIRGPEGPDTAAVSAGPHALATLPPWIPFPRQAADEAALAGPLTGYIDAAASAIAARVNQLADSAISQRPPWTSLLGTQPAEPEYARQWRRHIAIIAAYRDQHKITDNDPRYLLGPYVEQGRAGHKAHVAAARAVLAARQIAGLDLPDDVTPDAQAAAQLAEDVYRVLPEDERTAIAAVLAPSLDAALPTAQDWAAQTAADPRATSRLIAVLTARGHLDSTFHTSQGNRVGGNLYGLAAGRRRRPAALSNVNDDCSRPQPALSSQLESRQHVPGEPGRGIARQSPVK